MSYLVTKLIAFHLQALDTFNTAIVSPIYYVMFTSLTILASVIMFKVISRHKMYMDRCMGIVALVHESSDCFLFLKQDWDRQNGTQIVTEMCGFVTILSGTFLLHRTKDMVEGNKIYTLYLL